VPQLVFGIGQLLRASQTRITVLWQSRLHTTYNISVAFSQWCQDFDWARPRPDTFRSKCVQECFPQRIPPGLFAMSNLHE